MNRTNSSSGDSFPSTAHEDHARSLGASIIAGVDEVGRGPLAGPVVAGAVILPENPVDLIGVVNDSKRMTPIKRRIAADLVKSQARAWALGLCSASEVDRLGIAEGVRVAMRKAVSALSLKPNYLLIDALSLPKIKITQLPLIRGDILSLSIAAASVIAKVARDDIMLSEHDRWPKYGFNSNKGYGTAKHIHALENFGPCPIHRHTFRRVMLMDPASLQKRLKLPDGLGKAGETAAAVYLRSKGFEILATNYRIQEGEADIIARADGRVAFVEVRTRSNRKFGPPEESLTLRKSERLIKVAQAYLQNEWKDELPDWGIDLLAIEMDRLGKVKRIELFQDAVEEIV